MMMNYRVTDKYNQTCVVLAHDEEQAIKRAFTMFKIIGINAVITNN